MGSMIDAEKRNSLLHFCNIGVNPYFCSGCSETSFSWNKSID